MNSDIESVLFSADFLQDTVKNLGKKITDDYKDKKLLLLGILKGSVVFMTDLMRCIDIPCEIDFMAVSTYGNGVKSSATVRIIKDLGRDIKDYDVLIIEDILDSGRTLSYLMEILYAKEPRSIRICALFDKPEGRKVDVFADYSGLQVPDEFIVGYGLDYAEKYRNLPYVGILKREIYETKE